MLLFSANALKLRIFEMRRKKFSRFRSPFHNSLSNVSVCVWFLPLFLIHFAVLSLRICCHFVNFFFFHFCRFFWYLANTYPNDNRDDDPIFFLLGLFSFDLPPLCMMCSALWTENLAKNGFSYDWNVFCVLCVSIYLYLVLVHFKPPIYVWSASPSVADIQCMRVWVDSFDNQRWC